MSWLIDTLLTTGALLALVLVLRRPVSRHFGPGAAYALWALPLLRLVIPPLVLPAPLAPPAAAGGPAELTLSLDPVAAVAPDPLAWLEPALLALWLAGALAYLVWRAIGYHALRKALLRAARPVGTVDDVRLVESSAVVTPLAFGIRDKVIALPPGFMTQADRTARDLAIAHELEHHAGRDLAVNMAMQPLLALHWFNPLAWLAWRALRRDQEAACDARVVAGRDADIRAAYGALIADYARAPRVSLAASIACPVVGEASVIYRLRSLTMTDPTPARRNIGRLLLAGAALALPLTASISYAAQEAPSAPPAAPAAPEVPAAPEAPAAPAIQTRHKIMIVEHPDGADAKDAKVQRRIVIRDGDKKMSPEERAEFEKDMAEMHRDLAEMHRELGPDGSMHREMRIAIRDAKASGAKVVISCRNPNQPVTSEPGKDGKPTLFVCETAGHNIARDAMAKARAAIAADPGMPAETKSAVLKNLDEEIDRLAKQG